MGTSKDVDVKNQGTNIKLVGKRNDPVEDERIVINVGGIKHETFRSTLKNFEDTRLHWIVTNRDAARDSYYSKNEFFFDRHPQAFAHILNYYRTGVPQVSCSPSHGLKVDGPQEKGAYLKFNVNVLKRAFFLWTVTNDQEVEGKLHLPTDICGPLFEEELEFWGIDEKLMEPCCWHKYTEHREAEENFKLFDHPSINPVDDDTREEGQEEREREDGEQTLNNMNSTTQDSEIKESEYMTIGHALYHRLSLLEKKERWPVIKKFMWKMFDANGSSITQHRTKIVAFISVLFVLISILSLCLHSMMDDNRTEHVLFKKVLYYVDSVTCTWFSLELLVRFITCPNRFRFIISMSTIMDIVALIPYYVNLSLGNDPMDSSVSAIFAVARLLRLIRFFNLSVGLHILKQTLFASSKELFFMLSMLFIPMAVFATLAYYSERKSNKQFGSIPRSMWWAIVTMTTVGYGDMWPHTDIGKCIGAICAAFSVLILALPISVIGNNFQLFYYYAQARRKLPKRIKKSLLGVPNSLVDTCHTKYAAMPLTPQPKRSTGKPPMFKNQARNRKSTLDENKPIKLLRKNRYNVNASPPDYVTSLFPRLQTRRPSLIDIEAARMDDLGLMKGSLQSSMESIQNSAHSSPGRQRPRVNTTEDSFRNEEEQSRHYISKEDTYSNCFPGELGSQENEQLLDHYRPIECQCHSRRTSFDELKTAIRSQNNLNNYRKINKSDTNLHKSASQIVLPNYASLTQDQNICGTSYDIACCEKTKGTKLNNQSQMNRIEKINHQKASVSNKINTTVTHQFPHIEIRVTDEC